MSSATHLESEGTDHKNAAGILIVVGVGSLVAAQALVPTSEFLQLNFYVVCWWSLIAALEGWNALRGRALFLGRGWSWFAEICGISAFLWFIFEFYNLWLGNWYYVGQPPNDVWRIGGTFVAFATVLPGMWEVKRAIDGLLGSGLDEGSPLGVSTPIVVFLLVVAIVGTFGPFVAPTSTFALVWGGLLAGVDLVEYRLGGPSFLREMEKGHYRNLVGWLLAGAVCGFVWEFWNSFAVCKWIYTVPFLGETRLFEMPVAGFLGFVPFAAMTWRLFESIYVRYRDWRISARAGFWVVAAMVSVGVRWAMVDITGVSTYPEDVRDFVGWTAQEQTLLEKHPAARTPREVGRVIDDSRVRQKLAFLEFGGIWIETGNCLWRAGYRSIDAVRSAPVEELTGVVVECRRGPRSFWRRRVVDWHQRPRPEGS